jgi:HK97 family phage portal protein
VRSGSSSLELIGVDASRAYSEVYRSSLWVSIAVNKLARGVARLPLHTFELEPDTGNRERRRDHPLADVLRKPFTKGSAFKLKESAVGDMGLYGHALWAKWRPGPGRPVEELWPIPWKHVSIIEGETQPIIGYEYRGAAKRVVFLPDDVLHFEFWGPEGRGVSPLEPLRRTLALEDAGQRYAISSFTNAARPAGVFVTTQPLPKPKKDELEAQLRSTHQGPDNAFRTLLLDGGLDWKPIGHNAQEAQTIEHRKLTREEVAAAYDIPPPMIHILDRATFSNIDEQHRMWYQDTLGPWLSMIEETIESQLIDEEPAFTGVFVEFDLNDVLKGDIEKRANAYTKLLAVYTINELRRLENLPKLDDPLADAVYAPLNAAPVGADAPADVDATDGAVIGAARARLVDMLFGGEKRGLDGAELAAALEAAGMRQIAERSRMIERDVLDLKYRPDAPALPPPSFTAEPKIDVHVHFPEGFVRGGDVTVQPQDVNVTVEASGGKRKVRRVEETDGSVSYAIESDGE